MLGKPNFINQMCIRLIMITDNREDYLIEILRLTKDGSPAKTSDLAKILGVSPASVSGMIKTLSKENLVKYKKYCGAILTEEGMQYAKQLHSKHHIIERFFTGVLGMSPDEAHDEAHRMEHIISDDSAIRICRIMGVPDEKCDLCTESCANDSPVKTGTVLGDLKQGQKGRISHIKGGDPASVRKLISMGFVPGREIEIDCNVSKSSPKVVTVGSSTIALDAETASSIYVEVDA